MDRKPKSAGIYRSVMKKAAPLFSALIFAALTSCGMTVAKTEKTEYNTTDTSGVTTDIREEITEMQYHQISQDEAKKMMEKDDGHVIVDVRTWEEYAEGHIVGAICIPNESISYAQPADLPDKDQIILVYCRSGRRSKEAAEKLARMGYTAVYEFGGIITWTGDTEK